MKIPLNWLREYVDITLAPAQLVERLTFAGLEVSGVRVVGLPIPDGLRVKAEERGPVWDRDKIVIAEVVSVERHPNADRLNLPTVKWGEGEGQVKQLVTGATNIKPGDKGQKVVLALTGSVLFDGHSAEKVKVMKELKPSKIRGVPSDAMVCSLLELGIADEHEGIIILEDDAPTGMPLADFMGDIIIEIDVLPNMARCLSMIGVAREVAAITGQELRYPSMRPEQMAKLKLANAIVEDFGKDDLDLVEKVMEWEERSISDVEELQKAVKVEIEDPKLCARYSAALIRDVKIGPAPGWMQRRLTYAGMRPINNIVDITNYVMLEWGQPLHAFDYDKLVERASQASGGSTPTIIVRPARPGEILVTLDGNKRELSPANLVIADTLGPIALAGVMGGAETEVSAATKNILLESASFDFVSIRRTMKQFNLPSEASVRFSKGIHPELVEPAARRAVDLMRQFASGVAGDGLVDNYPAPLPAQVVELKMSEVKRILGVDFPMDLAVRILRMLEFQVEAIGTDTLRAVVPPHRLDIQDGPADLMEELVRIHGYDRLPDTLLADRLPRQRTNVPIVLEERVRDILVSSGLQEVITYALTMPEKEAPLTQLAEPTSDGDYVRLKNPISSERTVMRRSLLASVLEVTASNLRHTNGVRFFEIGFIYVPHAGQKLPDEPRRLALCLTGNRAQEFWNDPPTGKEQARTPLDFFDLKGVIEDLVNDLHLPDVQYRSSTAKHLHPGRSACLTAAGQVLGDFGELHPRTAAQYKLGERAVLVAELDVDALQAAVPARYGFRPVPQFPAALRDIALVVDESIPAERIVAEIRAAGGELLHDVRLFDVYRGDSISAGTKSLAYALTYQAGDRTLTDKEIDKAHKKIEDRLKHILKARIRGEES
jgi:phenylalanyl-tRNA synthetase beta chain